MHTLTGTIASPGFGHAHAYFVPNHESSFSITLPTEETQQVIDTALEYQRFIHARECVAESIQHWSENIAWLFAEGEPIFEGQRLLLYDAGFVARFQKELERGPYSAEKALQRALHIYEGFVHATAHKTFAMDLLNLQDAWQHVLSYLQTGSILETYPAQQASILVADALYPSQLAQMSLEHIKGIITGQGDPQSSLAFLAQRLRIPYICNVEHWSSIPVHAELLIDAELGSLWISPSPQTLGSYESSLAQWKYTSEEANIEPQVRIEQTQCGHIVEFHTHLEASDSLHDALTQEPTGILFADTVSLFEPLETLPSNSEQECVYTKLLKRIHPSAATFQTFSLSSQHSFVELPIPPEQNPLLGWRGVRVTLAHRSVLLHQLIALLKSSTLHPLKILLPCVSTLEELEDVQTLLHEAQQHLHDQGHETFQYTLGLLLETPSAAYMLQHFVQHVDFIVVQTDTLLSLTMGAEFGNPRLLHLLSPLQPAFIRQLSHISQIAQEYDVPTWIAGNMPMTSLGLPLLLGMGFRSFTLPPHRLPATRTQLQHIRIRDAERLAQESAEATSLQHIFRLTQSFIQAQKEDNTNEQSHSQTASESDRDTQTITPALELSTAKEPET